MSALPTCADESLAAERELTRLYQAHSSEILAFCRRSLHSQSDAEDATQTTFLYALRALRRGVVPDCEPAWLTAIAKNVCHTQRRTLDRRGPLAGGADQLDRIALAQPEYGDFELIEGLTDALNTLPGNQRTALVMREWLGLAPAEIAPRLGLTPMATNALLTRARRSVVTALTTTVGRPLSALNIALLVDALRMQLKALLAGASSKAAVGVVVVGVAAGGVVVERSLADPVSPAPAGSSGQPADSSPSRGVSEGTDGLQSSARQVVPVGKRGSVRGAPVAPAIPGSDEGRPTTEASVDTASRPPALLPPAPAPTKESPGSPGAVEEKPVSPEVKPPDLPVLPELELPLPEIEPSLLPPLPVPELPLEDPLPPLPPLPVEIPELPLVPNLLG
jgi:RNA polymerase sigma factor (sigma-70 family)